MLLNNYYKYVGLLFGKNSKMTDNSGKSVPISGLINYSQECLVGSGSAPAKVDDYKLERKIEGLNTTFTVNVSENGTKIVNIISNLTNETVTISEIGIACCSNNTGTNYLMTRTVLEKPIVLEVGDVVAIDTQFA